MSFTNQVLPTSFYARHDALAIAKELLGKILVSQIDGIRTSGYIVETEAYMAPDDLACHARGNRRTPRCETMFGNPGIAYVYKCYGIHDLFNTVTASVDTAHAVLVRAIQPLENVETMMSRRGFTTMKRELTNGPGKLTTALGISTDLDAIDLCNLESPVFIMESDSWENTDILEGPRVGMSRHVKHCAHYPWRYSLKNNKWVSKPSVVQYDW